MTRIPSLKTIFLFIFAFLSSKLLQAPPQWLTFWKSPSSECEAAQYTTEIISTDPLLIYINNFVSSREADSLIHLGEPLLTPSTTSHTLHSSALSPSRTSLSASLPRAHALTSCLLARTRAFLGPAMALPPPPPLFEAELPQLVRYAAPGQKFEVHTDWFPQLQPLPRHRGLWCNRVASFFVYLDEPSPGTSSNTSASSPSSSSGETGSGGGKGGETWFPHVDVAEADPRGRWRQGEENKGKGKGGVAFVPRKGNAVFWVNLHANGTGDWRVRHAGLELGEGMGVKTGMNIWARKVFWRKFY